MQTKTSKPAKITDISKNMSLLAIVVTASIITLSVSYLEYLEFDKTVTKIESDYTESQKKILKQEVNKVVSYIKFNRSDIEQKTKARIKSRVYDAHKVATNIFKKFKGKLPNKEIKKLIVEALRPLRFFNNDGYYFITNLQGINQLHALHPEYEGKNVLKIKDSNGNYFVRDIRDLVLKSKEGFLTYKYLSFNNRDSEQSKITFVKLFKPFNWFIGTGDYTDNIKSDIQKILINYIQQVRFGENGYIFVVKYDGTVLMNPIQTNMIGKNVWNIKDSNGVKFIQQGRKIVDNPEGGFIHYIWQKPSTAKLAPKVSYMKSIKDWQWMIGAGLYLDDIQSVIMEQKTRLQSGIIKHIFLILFISLLVSIIVVYVTNIINKRFTRELGLFLKFFKNLSVTSDKIAVESLSYFELKELATTANRMLEKQIEIEEERIKTEDLLRSSESNLKEAQKITHFGSWKYNIKSDKLFWSDEVFRIFELSPDKVIPSYELFLTLVHPDDIELVNKTYKDSIVNKTTYDVEHRIKLKRGKIKLVREHGKTFYDENGEPLRSTGTIQDVTDIRLKEEQLKRSQKMDALGKLTGGIAHDYNNILGIIIGYSDLLLDHVSNDPKMAKYVEHIIDASKRGRNLTKKLMTFSRYKKSIKSIININTEIEKQHSMLEKTLTARIKLITNLAEDIWPIEVDLDDLNDSIINMAINASHAIESNGKLTIKTRNVHLEYKITRGLGLSAGDYVSLSITDTGVGMDTETQSRIFDPFFTTKGAEGTGLGLSQVYGFIKRSHGSINIVSELNYGTEFTMYFPRHSSPPKLEEQPNSKHDIKSNGNESILIVDDEPALCEMACSILQPQGYTVFKANSADQALAILKSNHIDLLLSDVIMPNVNGYKLAAEVQKNYPDIIIQLVSGYNDTFVVATDIEISKLDVFQKPYTKNELLNQVNKLFKRHY
ncbi:MAG: cache domain-containing protein [Gammaproteobacteria bacterium]